MLTLFFALTSPAEQPSTRITTGASTDCFTASDDESPSRVRKIVGVVLTLLVSVVATGTLGAGVILLGSSIVRRLSKKLRPVLA